MPKGFGIWFLPDFAGEPAGVFVDMYFVLFFVAIVFRWKTGGWLLLMMLNDGWPAPFLKPCSINPALSGQLMDCVDVGYGDSTGIPMIQVFHSIRLKQGHPTSYKKGIFDPVTRLHCFLACIPAIEPPSNAALHALTILSQPGVWTPRSHIGTSPVATLNLGPRD